MWAAGTDQHGFHDLLLLMKKKEKKEVKKSDAFEFVWRIFYFVFTKFLPERHSCCKLIHLIYWEATQACQPSVAGLWIWWICVEKQVMMLARFCSRSRLCLYKQWERLSFQTCAGSLACWEADKTLNFILLTNIQCSLSKNFAKQIIQAWVVQNYCLTQMLHTRFCCQRPAKHLAVSSVGGQCS